jgi:hypothetical protein
MILADTRRRREAGVLKMTNIEVPAAGDLARLCAELGTASVLRI